MNDVDYWGVNLYGVWDAGLINMIGSIGRLQTNNDISQDGRNAAPDVSAFTMSARFEKTFALGAGYAATPHIGVLWAHINMDDFVSGGFRYENETVDLHIISDRCRLHEHVYRRNRRAEAIPGHGDSTDSRRQAHR